MVLAKWLASPENPYFATNLANIVWAHFFGTGIIEPVDDVRVSNPASNPELLDELGKQFTEYKYDFKKLVRDICTSRTYQLSTQRERDATRATTRNFAHGRSAASGPRRCSTASAQVTETKNKFQRPAAGRPGRADRRRRRDRPTSSPPSAAPPARRSARAR